MLKCECPVEAGGWAGEGEHGAKPGRPGNVRTERRRWGGVSKDRWQGLVGGGRLREEGMAHPEHGPISTDSIRRGGRSGLCRPLSGGLQDSKAGGQGQEEPLECLVDSSWDSKSGWVPPLSCVCGQVRHLWDSQTEGIRVGARES